MSTGSSAGGLDPRRPDQVFSPPPMVTAPGATAGVFKGRLVIISGTSSNGSTGLFVYTNAPGPGTLVASIASTSGTDPYGNAYTGPGFAAYGGGEEIFMGLVGSVLELQFRTGAVFELNVANVAAGVTGSGPAALMQLLLSGPQGSTAGGTDWVQLQMISNNDGATGNGEGLLNYIDTAAVGHTYLAWGQAGTQISAGRITAPDPSTGTVTTPAIAETWHTFSLSVGAAGTDINGTAYPPAYQLLPNGNVAIKGAWVAPVGNYTAGTTWTTIPAAYRPTTNIPVAFISNGAAAIVTHLYIRPNGNVQFNNNITAGTTMYLDCILLVAGT